MKGQCGLENLMTIKNGFIGTRVREVTGAFNSSIQQKPTGDVAPCFPDNYMESI